MAYNTHYLAPKFVPTIFCLPVGIGLLRLRFLWRRCALAGVWCGYTLLLFILGVVFAKANGLTLLQGTTPMEFFGWNLNAIQATWVGLISFFGYAALLAWLQPVLMRPQVKVLFEQQRGRGAGWLETLVVIWLVLFAFAWIPQKAQTLSAPAHLTAPTGENLSFGPAYGHEQEFRWQLAESIPVREYGYTIKELMFTDDYRKALVVFTHTNDQARLSQDNRQRRPDWEFTLDSNGFRRYRGFAMQPFYTPGSANTPPIYVTVVLPDK
jgi:hypothetical protein